MLRDYLIAARALIAQGFIKDRLYNDRDNPTCFCAYGAVLAVAPDRHTVEDMGKVLDEATPLTPDDDDCAFQRTITYNDLPETTQADVIALFDKAIANA